MSHISLERLGSGGGVFKLGRRPKLSEELSHQITPLVKNLPILGFGVPYFNTFFLKGTLMK